MHLIPVKPNESNKNKHWKEPSNTKKKKTVTNSKSLINLFIKYLYIEVKCFHFHTSHLNDVEWNGTEEEIKTTRVTEEKKYILKNKVEMTK